MTKDDVHNELTDKLTILDIATVEKFPVDAEKVVPVRVVIEALITDVLEAFKKLVAIDVDDICVEDIFAQLKLFDT